MAEHDDELDRRITALLALAQQDAPAPANDALPQPGRSRRWLAAAAAVVLVGGGVTALALRDEPVIVAPSESTRVDTTSTPTQSSVAPSTTVAEGGDCSAPAVDAYDTVGSMHTIVESSQALDIEIEALGGPWCPGGTGLVRVTATNIGASQEELIPLQLILNGGMNKYPLALAKPLDETGGLSIAPNSGITVEVHVTVPAAPPGPYTVQLYGFGSGADVRIEGPLACATADLAAVAGPSTGSALQVLTPITVTNTGTTPCFLGKPVIVLGANGSAAATQIPFDDGGYYAANDSRPSRVLNAGEVTTVVLTTDNSCIDDTPNYWATLQLVLDLQLSSAVEVAFGPDSRVQTQCGLFVAGWAAPVT
jgi:hypothetical protein